jgi:DNA repair exonuclease SbcCD nuclease subunit
MSEIRIVSSSDEHLCDYNPGFRKDLYRSAILRKLEFQGNFAKKFSANWFLRGGDFFHVKSPGKTSHRTISDVLKIHRLYPCPIYSLIGNHDMQFNNLDTVDKQPLNVLYESGTFKPLVDEIIESGTIRVRIIGVSYIPDLNIDILQETIRRTSDDVYTIAVVHALASNAPIDRFQSFYGEQIFDYRDLIFDGCPDVYIFGHYHKDQGIQKLNGTYFVNLGSISRGSLTFENLERKPKISSLIFNSQGINVEEHIIPHDDAADVFDLEKKKQLDQERKSLNDFITQLQSGARYGNKDAIRSRFESFDWDKYGPDLRQVVSDTIEAAEAGILVDD